MAKKNKIDDQTKYRPELLEDIMGQGFGRYAKYIIQERALPDARDGLKPAILAYVLYDFGISGDCLAGFQPQDVSGWTGNDSFRYRMLSRKADTWPYSLAGGTECGLHLVSMHVL